MRIIAAPCLSTQELSLTAYKHYVFQGVEFCHHLLDLAYFLVGLGLCLRACSACSIRKTKCLKGTNGIRKHCERRGTECRERESKKKRGQAPTKHS